MKINTTKLIVGVLAVTGVASLVGSVSGTVAWFQYNTRATAEFSGTSAKCSEFLQVRAVYDPVVVSEVNEIASSGLTVGAKYLNTTDNKIYTATSTATTDGGVAATDGLIINNGTQKKKYSESAWTVTTDTYSAWATSIANVDILNAAKRADNGLSPVTLPFKDTASDLQDATIDGTTNKFYGHPICGYELYDAADGKPYHWDTADAVDYMSFKLQFRVLDIDGKTVDAGKEALLAKDVWLTDLTIAKDSSSSLDLSSAIRVQIHGSDDAILAYGDTTSDGTKNLVETQTYGALDLDLDNTLDNTLDVPGAHYSFNTETATTLSYGSDKKVQKAYNVNSKTATGVSSIYPTDDGVGNLSEGLPFGTTDANVSGTAETTWLELTFTIWLEGWAKLPTTSTGLGETGASNSIWNAANVIGSKFNIGMSFGVDALD